MKKSEDKHIRYIDSTTHRVYKMVGRPFVLHNGSQKLRIKVNLVDSDSKNNGLASLKIEMVGDALLFLWQKVCCRAELKGR